MIALVTMIGSVPASKASQRLEQYEQPCAGYKCADCTVQNYRFKVKGDETANKSQWNIRVALINNLIDVRNVMLAEGVTTGKNKLDKALYRKVSILLNHRFENMIANDYYELIDHGDLNSVKTHFEAFPLDITSEEHSALYKLFELNDL